MIAAVVGLLLGLAPALTPEAVPVVAPLSRCFGGAGYATADHIATYGHSAGVERCATHSNGRKCRWSGQLGQCIYEQLDIDVKFGSGRERARTSGAPALDDLSAQQAAWIAGQIRSANQDRDSVTLSATKGLNHLRSNAHPDQS